MKEPISDVYEDAFKDVDKQCCLLDVPEDSGSLYRKAPVWRDFWKVAAEDEKIVDGMTYEVNSEGTVTLVSANHSAGGRYEIPSSVVIDGVESRVTAIGENAFSGCTNLTAVTIPSSIISIGSGAFAGCENLAELFCLGTDPIDLSSVFTRMELFDNRGIAVFPFEGVDLENCILYVPAGSLEKYRSADGWCLFKHIVEIVNYNSIETIYIVAKDSGMYNLQGLKASSSPIPQRHGVYIVNGKKYVMK